MYSHRPHAFLVRVHVNAMCLTRNLPQTHKRIITVSPLTYALLSVTIPFHTLWMQGPNFASYLPIRSAHQ